jgi:hypothetical protein
MSEGIRKLLLQAVELALGGDWQAAHLIAQDHEGNELANWIHAVCHRMEGDLGNARYWYRRCSRSLDEGTSTHDELLQIRAALEA